jgi:hypothetical protein
VKSGKLKGFHAKARNLTGLTDIDPGSAGSDPLDLDPTTTAGGRVK